ncbi:MAG TPA: PQQ-binding-like beta-propeller repeat protein, partial [Acidimicrobiales bacterium]|nr:PQQ-binding-like beta-propeller repeat protein [Acidimicrobiales bacterium]
DLCYRENSVGGAASSFTTVNPATGRGELVALDLQTGRRLWRRRLPSPDFGCATVARDVVFTSTLDGTLYAFRAADGGLLWRTRAPAGINACPSVVDGRLFVAAGMGSTPELVAYEASR